MIKECFKFEMIFYFLNIKHHMDPSIGVYVIDRFTYFTLEFLEGVTQNSKKTVFELVSFCLVILKQLYYCFFYF